MNLDLSLDEIISKEKKLTRMRRPFRQRKTDVYRFKKDRVNRSNPATSSSIPVPDKVMISNLASGVTQNDIQVLFGNIGPVVSAQLNFDSNGKSRGTAFVVFKNPADAHRAIREYHNRTLDGSVMKLEMIYKVKRGDYLLLRDNANASGKLQKRNKTPGQRRGVRFNKRRGNRGARRTPKTQEDLNAEMDAYMKGKNMESMEIAQESGQLDDKEVINMSVVRNSQFEPVKVNHSTNVQQMGTAVNNGINLALANALED